MSIGGRQAWRVADRAVDITDQATTTAHNMVVVIAHPRLITRYRSRGLNPANQTRRSQCVQNVVDRLARHIRKTEAYRTEHGVGIGMRVGMDRFEYSHPGPGHPQVSYSQLIGVIRH